MHTHTHRKKTEQKIRDSPSRVIWHMPITPIIIMILILLHKIFLEFFIIVNDGSKGSQKLDYFITMLTYFHARFSCGWPSCQEHIYACNYLILYHLVLYVADLWHWHCLLQSWPLEEVEEVQSPPLWWWAQLRSLEMSHHHCLLSPEGRWAPQSCLRGCLLSLVLWGEQERAVNCHEQQ